MHGRMGIHFWVFTFLRIQNMIFQNGCSVQFDFLTSIPFLSQGNNFLNQFLVVINDWVNKTRKVVDSLMGFPFDIWLFPIGSKV